MRIFPSILLIFFLLSYMFPIQIQTQTISGDLKIWHKVIIDFEGPMTFETNSPNPFTDFRLDVEFRGPSGQQFRVPGFYAADGIAGESSADTGNIWRVLFTPNEVGTWSFSVSFLFGKNIAAELTGGISSGYFDGAKGEFVISDSEITNNKDFRNKGKLVYADDHFLQFMGNKEYFLKGGVNSPEVFLEYEDFDNTPSNRSYSIHKPDWTESDPTWQDGKGKGIIGTINYLSNLGVNVFYFLTMNAYGDGKNAWPWIHQDSITVYDCSKLDQWTIVFDHVITKGIMPHIVLTETENESFFEIVENSFPGGFADSRKIYFREMVARFGYLCAVTWNIGEENGWADGYGFNTANTDEQRKVFAERLRKLTYYNDHIAIHNGPSTDDKIYYNLLENKSITGPALQWGYGNEIYGKVLEWRTRSAERDYKWVVSMDEPWINDEIGSLDDWRKEIVWGTFMAGGAGVELYIGAGKDLSVEDFNQYKIFYETTTIAIEFFKKYVPFWEMTPNDSFAVDAWTLINKDSFYVIYLKNGGTVTVDLPEGLYNVKWFDPRNGGELQMGTVAQISSSRNSTIGKAPFNINEDWVCLIRKISSIN